MNTQTGPGPRRLTPRAFTAVQNERTKQQIRTQMRRDWMALEHRRRIARTHQGAAT